MAAEYQLKEFAFFGALATNINIPEEIRYDGQTWFTVHPLHDLESLFWIYLWFIYFRLLSQTIETASGATLKHLQQSRRTIRDRAKQFFFCTIHGTQRRTLMVVCSTSTIGAEVFRFQPFYTDCPKLLDPLLFIKELSKEYLRIQTLGPLKNGNTWQIPLARFSEDTLYRTLENILVDTLGAMGSEAFPVQDADAILKVKDASTTAEVVGEHKGDALPEDALSALQLHD